MKLLSLCLIVLIPLAFNLSKPARNSHIHTGTHAQDSIYRVWKFTGVDFVKSPATAEPTCPTDIDLDNYGTWDLTNKGVLRYNFTDTPGVFHSVYYKLIDNAITLQYSDKRNSVTSFKIKELTPKILKLIVHVTCDMGGKSIERDVVELDFEVKN
ncbi:MAG: hypothetical protein JSU01_22115 [Bacteroidetes bacterium]|nr:hypothetical protein [Bacteroidota bacterium]